MTAAALPGAGLPGVISFLSRSVPPARKKPARVQTESAPSRDHRDLQAAIAEALLRAAHF